MNPPSSPQLAAATSPSFTTDLSWRPWRQRLANLATGASFCALAIALLLVACTPARTRPPLPAGAIEICEPCVGTIGEYSIGVGNIWERDLPGPDGVVAKRPAAMLSIWRRESDGGVEQHLTVFPGAEFKLGDGTYRVIEVDIPPGASGSVRIQKR